MTRISVRPKSHARPRETTASIGDLVVAAFEEAARVTADPRQVARLATIAVMRLLRHRGATGNTGGGTA
jgi:hypothetical protein